MSAPANTLTVYRASAGSGKTFSLTVEYIALLMESPHDDEFKHILAVTFTNKATGEMKDRILGQLYGIAHGLASSSNYAERVLETLRQRGKTMSHEELRDKSQKALVAILHDYHNFRVETIDSFFQSILRSLAHELGLSANLQVELNDNEILSKAVDQMFDELKVVDEGITKWILKYTEEKMSEGKSWDVSSDIKAFAQNIYKEEFRNRSSEERLALSDPKKINDFLRIMHSIIALEEREMRTSVEKTLQVLDSTTDGFKLISNGIRYYRNFIDSLPDRLRDFRELTNTLKEVVGGNVVVMLQSKHKEDPDMLSMATDVAERLRDVYAEYQERFKRAYTAHVAIKHINKIRLLGVIEANAKAVAEGNNQFLLTNTPVLLSELVKGYDAPFVYEKAGIKFHHIMIDEFQDTSRMQWNNFKVLLFNNKAEGSRDLVVGDIKQSIYRWRGGDWRILHYFDDPCVGVPGSEMKSLQHNFRSMGNVISFNNGFFQAASQMLDASCSEMEKMFSIRDIYKDVEQKIASSDKVEKGYVRILLHSNDKESYTKEDYEMLLAQDLREQILRLYHPDGSQPSLSLNRMAIIVRRKESGANLIRLFRDIERENPQQPHIPLVSDDAYLLSASLAVQMIVAALRVLEDPQNVDKVSYSYLVLHYHHDVLADEMSVNDLMFQPSEQLLPEVFAKHLADLAILPLYVLIERLFALLSLEKLEGQGAYMMTFLDYVLQFAQTNSADIRSFLKYWDDTLCNKSIFAGEMNALRILTVHKSKGLEYDAVFIPDLDWDIESDGNSRSGEILWTKAIGSGMKDDSSSKSSEEEVYNTLGALPINPESGLMHTFYSSPYELEHLDRRVDALNLLYVAFTRARSNLFVWGRYSKDATFNPSSPTPWDGALTSSSLAADMLKFYIMQQDSTRQADDQQMLWEMGHLYCEQQSSVSEDGNRMDAEKEDVEQPFHTYEPHYTFFPSNATRRFLSSLSEDESHGVTQQAWEVGIIVHRILSHINNLSQVDAALEACKRDGLIASEELAEKVQQSLDAGFQLDAVKRWFSTDAQTFNECTITGRDSADGTPFVRRPDRVVIHGDDIYIVDFKLGHDQPAYHDQVRGYMRLLQQMYPQRRVYGSLWFILQRKIVDVKLKD